MGRMEAGETEPAGPPHGAEAPGAPGAPAAVKGRRPADYTISVLGKALDLLDVLADARSISLPEISQRAGINKVTAFRILANFEERGYVEREPGSGQYRLGLRLLELSTRLRERLDLRTVARPHLEALRAAVGETVNLAVPGGRGIVYIDILESAYGLRMAASVGEADDYHSTALGKAMLAFWPEERRTAVLGRRRLTRKTERTLTDRRALRRDLALCHAQGYAVDDEENEAGARCIGAPVLDDSGRVVGALSVSGPGSRVTPERVPAVAARVVQAADAVSRGMGAGPALRRPSPRRRASPDRGPSPAR